MHDPKNIIPIILQPKTDDLKIAELENLNLSENDLSDILSTANTSILHEATFNSGSKLIEWLLHKCYSLINRKSDVGTNVLFYAAKYSNLAAFNLIFKKNPSLFDEINDNGQNIAHFIGLGKDATILKENNLTIKEKLNIADKFGHFPIHCAASSNNVGFVSFLLSQGVPINQLTQNEFSITPFHIATIHNQLEMATFLQEKGADINVPNSQGVFPIHVASSNGCLPFITFLIEKGQDVNQPTQNELAATPLHISMLKNRLDIAKLLYEKGAKINTPNNQGWCPIHLASEKGLMEFVAFFIEKGIDVNQPLQNESGSTPFHIATIYNQFETAKLLYEKGAKINTPNNQGWFSIHLASEKGLVEFIAFLIEKGIDVNQPLQNEFCSTPLHVATANNRIEVVKLLNEKGAKINTSNNKGWFPIHRACEKGSTECVAFLIEKGANVNQPTQNEYRTTPLCMAAANNQIETAKILLKRGADINASINKGYRPIDIAAGKGHTTFVAFLLDHKANTNSTVSPETESPLFIAAKKGEMDCVRLLITHPNSNAILYNEKHTLLTFAIAQQQIDLVQLILQFENEIKQKFASNDQLYQPLINQPNKGGYSPIHMIMIEICNLISSTTHSIDKFKVLINYLDILIEKGADINALDFEKNSPLHLLINRIRLHSSIDIAHLLYIVHTYLPSIIKTFFDHGFNANLENNVNKTLIDVFLEAINNDALNIRQYVFCELLNSIYPELIRNKLDVSASLKKLIDNERTLKISSAIIDFMLRYVPSMFIYLHKAQELKKKNNEDWITKYSGTDFQSILSDVDILKQINVFSLLLFNQTYFFYEGNKKFPERKLKFLFQNCVNDFFNFFTRFLEILKPDEDINNTTTKNITLYVKILLRISHGAPKQLLSLGDYFSQKVLKTIEETKEKFIKHVNLNILLKTILFDPVYLQDSNYTQFLVTLFLNLVNKMKDLKEEKATELIKKDVTNVEKVLSLIDSFSDVFENESINSLKKLYLAVYSICHRTTPSLKELCANFILLSKLEFELSNTKDLDTIINGLNNATTGEFSSPVHNIDRFQKLKNKIIFFSAENTVEKMEESIEESIPMETEKNSSKHKIASEETGHKDKKIRF